MENEIKGLNKTQLKDVFETILGKRVPSTQLNNYVKNNFGEELTHMELIALGQILKAQNERDTRAAEFIRDTIGQKPGDKHEISGSKENPFIVTLDKELDKWSN